MPRRVLVAGGAAAIAAAGVAFPLHVLASRGTGHGAGASSRARASARARRGSQARPGSVPSPIGRVLVPGPAGPAGRGPGSAVLSPDGSMVAFTTSDPGGARVWLLDASDMHVAASIALGHGPSLVVFGPDSRSLVDLGFGGQPDAARLWRLETVGTTALNLVTSAAAPWARRAPRASGAVAFSPDGGTLAVSGDAGLSLLDVATLRTSRSVAAPPGASGRPVYRPDGKVLAVGGAPGSPGGGSLGAVCLLDAASLRTVAAGVLPGGAGVTAAAAAGFTPDGTVLAGYSLAGDAVAWLLQVSTMKIITSTQVGTTGDVTGLAVDLSADGKTLMAAYTSKQAQAGRALLYQIEPV